MVDDKSILFNKLLFIKEPFKYNLMINRTYLNYMDREDLYYICRMYFSINIITMDDDILYQLEEK